MEAHRGIFPRTPSRAMCRQLVWRGGRLPEARQLEGVWRRGHWSGSSRATRRRDAGCALRAARTCPPANNKLQPRAPDEDGSTPRRRIRAWACHTARALAHVPCRSIPRHTARTIAMRRQTAARITASMRGGEQPDLASAAAVSATACSEPTATCATRAPSGMSTAAGVHAGPVRPSCKRGRVTQGSARANDGKRNRRAAGTGLPVVVAPPTPQAASVIQRHGVMPAAVNAPRALPCERQHGHCLALRHARVPSTLHVSSAAAIHRAEDAPRAFLLYLAIPVVAHAVHIAALRQRHGVVSPARDADGTLVAQVDYRLRRGPP